MNPPRAPKAYDAPPLLHTRARVEGRNPGGHGGTGGRGRGSQPDLPAVPRWNARAAGW